VPKIFEEQVLSGRSIAMPTTARLAATQLRSMRLRQVAAALRPVEFGQEARERRARVGKRVAAGQLAPLPASLIGPERLPAEAFLPETIEKLLAS